jgi:hypothetical protein
MPNEKPVINICTYKVKPGKQAEMERLLERHWPTLHGAGLVTDERARVYRSVSGQKSGGEHDVERTYVEIFSWKSGQGPGLAHQTPAVMAVWEPMGALCEEMHFPAFELLDLPAR